MPLPGSHCLMAPVWRPLPNCLPGGHCLVGFGYNAKIHVGGSNHGPSMTIGLGDYTGGELWQYDTSGDYEMVAKDDMPAYRHLKADDRMMGRLVVMSGGAA